jgi:hypothetical protein
VLAPWTRRRRQDLLDLLDQLTPKIQELTRALEEEVEKRAATAISLESNWEISAGFSCKSEILWYIFEAPAKKNCTPLAQALAA